MLFEKEIAKVGYLSRSVPEGIDLKEAILKMKRALDEYIIEGVKTTIPFHQKLMANEEFNKGNFTTKFMETFEF